MLEFEIRWGVGGEYQDCQGTMGVELVVKPVGRPMSVQTDEGYELPGGFSKHPTHVYHVPSLQLAQFSLIHQEATWRGRNTLCSQ